jgi:acyl-CoA synthetase (AMP-forming)/AMP-acid ligase II
VLLTWQLLTNKTKQKGSNGAPKGVEISHAALVATQAGLVPMLEAGGEWVVDSDVFYAHNTFASTFHFTLLFTLLACGATIGMPSEVLILISLCCPHTSA